MLERRIDADDLGICLRLDEAGRPVTGVAPDAAALPRVRLVAHDPDGHRERPVAESREIVDEPLDPRLVAERGMEVGRRRRRLGRVDAADAVDVIQMLRLRVVRLEVGVADGPRR
jgi:hypothetical protein